MARFGVEGIRYFSNLRASGVATADDLTYTFNICNGLDENLRDAGHTRGFYWANDDCWEQDLTSTSLGGGDNDWADNVDLFFLNTHGNHQSGNALIAYDVKINEWLGNSSRWRLGDNNIEWLLIYGCETVDLGGPTSMWNIFQRLHEFCGAWGNMWDGITTDECGEDVADNLTSGETVVNSWIDGVSDWWVDNHPIVLAAETGATFNGGNFLWPLTTNNLDHFWDAGFTASDIFPGNMAWMSWTWSEG
jgi:hypothetical protein